MKNLIRNSIIMLFIAVLVPSMISAQKRHDQFKERKIGIPRFSTDYAIFKGSSGGELMLEVYTKIPLRILYTVIENTKEYSEYEIAVIVRDADGKQVTGASWQNRLENNAKDRPDIEQSPAILEKKTFKLETDEYSVEVILTDLVSNVQGKSVIDLDLNDYESPGIVSSIMFTLKDDSQLAIKQENYSRYGKLIVPTATRTFDSENDLPNYYYELYPNKHTPDIFGIRYKIEGISIDRTVLDDSVKISVNDLSTGVITIEESLNIGTIPPGKYRIHLEVYDADYSSMLTSRKADFIIDWSLKTLVENNFDIALDHLRYIATHEERKDLKKVDRTVRLDAISRFWKKHDPTPTTPQNELKEEYYSRVKYVNNNFSNFGRPGYLTDFGMVFITYGRPEQIERHPFELNSKPYEIWYYYRHNRKFIFVDKTGYGSYELAYPYPDGLKM
ncbi:MAG: GWxTD domain-containing protein [candidate division Zixibacteria bacterium]|nr:GWxTD domain-containing protein [candidate division Zixibacteria bacterium]